MSSSIEELVLGLTKEELEGKQLVPTSKRRARSPGKMPGKIMGREGRNGQAQLPG